MFSQPISNVDDLDARLNEKYIVIFVPRIHPTSQRFLNFRHDAAPLVDHLAKNHWLNYTVLTTQACVSRLNLFLSTQISEGVVVVRMRRAERLLNGFDPAQFVKLMQGFDPHAKPPIISNEVLDELMGKNYLIVFFPKAHVSRFLDFRHDTDPLCWELISQKLFQYTALRQGWVNHMKATRGVKIDFGVAFFKRGVLKKELASFDKKEFLKVLKEFDPLNPNDPPKPGEAQQPCCACTVL
ncbi:hypothetical protein IWW55_005692 [Coemansia sp. RSA 2706]|nr:hypothetical protein IWW55_005692 [Coemansia sp. RSA 2706]KAJ2714638.1 hypothetical protein H4R23_005742 [Coemansia sp. Cherry 401B]